MSIGVRGLAGDFDDTGVVFSFKPVDAGVLGWLVSMVVWSVDRGVDRGRLWLLVLRKTSASFVLSAPRKLIDSPVIDSWSTSFWLVAFGKFVDSSGVSRCRDPVTSVHRKLEPLCAIT